jgi:hypothetical protein
VAAAGEIKGARPETTSRLMACRAAGLPWPAGAAQHSLKEAAAQHSHALHSQGCLEPGNGVNAPDHFCLQAVHAPLADGIAQPIATAGQLGKEGRPGRLFGVVFMGLASWLHAWMRWQSNLHLQAAAHDRQPPPQWLWRRHRQRQQAGSGSGSRGAAAAAAAACAHE